MRAMKIDTRITYDRVYYWIGGTEQGQWRTAHLRGVAPEGKRKAVEAMGYVAVCGRSTIGPPEGPPSPARLQQVLGGRQRGVAEGWVSVPVGEVRPGDIYGARCVDGSYEPKAVREVRPQERLPSIELVLADGSKTSIAWSGLYASAVLWRPITVGMGGTMYVGSDSYPVTVQRVSRSGHRIEVTKDVKRGSLFFEKPDAERRVFTRRKDGAYRERGRGCGVFLTLGTRHQHLDPHV